MQSTDREKYPVRSFNQSDIEIDTPRMKCRIFWARIVSYENESLFTRYTKHTFYEIQYALDGHIGMVTDRGNLFVAESDFTVIPPDTFHQVIDADSYGARFIMAFSAEMKDTKLQNALLSLDQLKTHKETPLMRQLLSFMLEKSKAAKGFTKESFLLMVECFMLEILEAVYFNISQTSKTVAENKERVKEMVEYIKSCGGIGVKVSDLAKKYSLSERHLARLFLDELGKTPREVLNREKLKKIEEYILSTHLSLGEISVLCGFGDEYAMNKFFKKHTQSTLTAFKKLSRPNHHS